MKAIVCTNCGCKKLIKTCHPFMAHDQHAIFSRNYPTLTIYACTKCGHLEFFDTYAMDEYNERCTTKAKLVSELQSLTKQYESVDYPSTITRIQDEIERTEHQLSNLDITIRQQQKLQEKLNDLTEKLISIKKEEYKIKEQIEKLDKKLRETNIALSKDEVIDG